MFVWLIGEMRTVDVHGAVNGLPLIAFLNCLVLDLFILFELFGNIVVLELLST